MSERDEMMTVKGFASSHFEMTVPRCIHPLHYFLVDMLVCMCTKKVLKIHPLTDGMLKQFLSFPSCRLLLSCWHYYDAFLSSSHFICF